MMPGAFGIMRSLTAAQIVARLNTLASVALTVPLSVAAAVTLSSTLDLSSASGRIAIGSAILTRAGCFLNPTFSGESGAIYGVYNTTITDGTNTSSSVHSLRGGMVLGHVTNTVTQLYAESPSGAGTVVNNYGLYIEAMTKGSSLNYAIFTNAGLVSFADRVLAGTIGATFKGNVLAGVQDATAAVSGQVGEIIESKITTATNAAATAAYQALTSITLTPGDWLISASALNFPNGATFTVGAAGVVELNISTTSASTAGTATGYDRFLSGHPIAAGDWLTLNAPAKRVNISASTTYYCNVYCTYTAGTPQWYGSITATRIR